MFALVRTLMVVWSLACATLAAATLSLGRGATGFAHGATVEEVLAENEDLTLEEVELLVGGGLTGASGVIGFLTGFGPTGSAVLWALGMVPLSAAYVAARPRPEPPPIQTVARRPRPIRDRNDHHPRAA